MGSGGLTVPVHQVPRHQFFPSGDCRDLVELRLSPAALTARHGLTFEELVDDLDEFEVAAIALADGTQVWLYRYRRDPSPGTAVRVDSHADFARTKGLLADALGLVDADFLWVSPAALATVDA